MIDTVVLQHIIKCIVKAKVVIVNLNGRNPNVFYELGIAHALSKPTILISHAENEVPFDLKNQYLVFITRNRRWKERGACAENALGTEISIN